MSGKAAIDDQLSTLWAIADITSVGLVAAEWGAFDLCNRSTGRAHRLHIFTGGFGFGFPGHEFKLLRTVKKSAMMPRAEGPTIG